ncbi:hypothetical protein C4D60_Mb09t00030 [Musa balbisiana]|uniref:Iron-sulphur binding protein LdpA C-terminal domain-containing protein n=1 Tax=Musa balbisiana TaxID=52838 RepID=A0A4S8ICW4_MUSBA|nr:hypothetical protein C4D60_Mb09t00030 [Musa balbisiana]
MDEAEVGFLSLHRSSMTMLSECGKFFMASQGGHRPQPVNECDIYSDKASLDHYMEVTESHPEAFLPHPSKRNSLGKSSEDKQARPEQPYIGGIAYGGYARKIVGKILHKMPTQHGHARIEDHPEYLTEAVKEAVTLIGPVKGYAELRF